MATPDENPLLGMFLQSLVAVALLWPFVLIAAPSSLAAPISSSSAAQF